MHTTALNTGIDRHAPNMYKQEKMILILRVHVTMNIGGNLNKAAEADMVFLSSVVTHNLTNTAMNNANILLSNGATK